MSKPSLIVFLLTIRLCVCAACGNAESACDAVDRRAAARGHVRKGRHYDAADLHHPRPHVSEAYATVRAMHVAVRTRLVGHLHAFIIFELIFLSSQLQCAAGQAAAGHERACLAQRGGAAHSHSHSQLPPALARPPLYRLQLSAGIFAYALVSTVT